MNGELFLARNWWSLALRGLVAVLFGLAIFIWPAITVEVLVLLFGAFAFIDGVFAIFAALSAKGGWVLILEGIVGIIIGLAAFFWPGITALVLVILFAAWAIATGILEIILTFFLHEEISARWLMAISGVISIVFGLVIAARPGTGLLVITWLIGAYAIVCGVLIFGLAMHLHGLGKNK